MRGCSKKTMAALMTLIAWVPQARSQEVSRLMEGLLKPSAGALEERLGKRDPDALKSAAERVKAPKKKLCFVDGHASLQRPSEECPTTAPGGSPLIE